MRRTIVLALAVALAAMLVPATGHAETRQVFMSAGFRFCVTAPACTANEDVTIRAGDTVQWVFADPACVALHAVGCIHTATRLGNVPQTFDSGPMPGPSPTLGLPSPKLTFERTFSVAGTFDYVCSLHVGNQNMRAKVIVTA